MLTGGPSLPHATGLFPLGLSESTHKETWGILTLLAKNFLGKCESVALSEILVLMLKGIPISYLISKEICGKGLRCFLNWLLSKFLGPKTLKHSNNDCMSWFDMGEKKQKSDLPSKPFLYRFPRRHPGVLQVIWRHNPVIKEESGVRAKEPVFSYCTTPTTRSS